MTKENRLVLAINAGSSSLKASLIRDKEDTHLATFLAERLSTEGAVIHFSVDGQTRSSKEVSNCDHEQALQEILDFLKQNYSEWLELLVACGHRVVHGGAIFESSVLIDDNAVKSIESVSHLAPLHNPHNLSGIKTALKVLPHIPSVAVFDTSFHTSLPVHARTYPLPQRYRDAGICKYGFHGTSVHYVSRKAADVVSRLKKKQRDQCALIVCHLGNGASVTAVQDGKSVETSMGFTPASGLMMGTRAGSVDPSVVSFAVHHLDLTVDQVLNDLNKESGLKAMSKDHEYDMRALLEQSKEGSHPDATLAIEMFVYRLAQHIAQSLVALSTPVDAIVFTAGIGEHSAEIRRRCIDQLSTNVIPGIQLDSHRNEKDGSESEGVLSPESSWPLVLDIPTDEQIMIAHECLRLTSSE